METTMRKSTGKEMNYWIGLVAILCLPIQYVLFGIVLSQLWAWFIVPTFNLPYLTLPISAGMLSMAYFVMPKKDVESTWENLMKGFVGVLSHAIVYLSVGFVIHLFVAR